MSVSPATTVLSRETTPPVSSSTAFSPLQNQVDQLTSGFLARASDSFSLLSMVAGGLAYRLGKIGTLALANPLLNQSPLFAPLVRMGSLGVGFAAEVNAFELSRRGLEVGVGGADPVLLNWNGPQGVKQGIVHSAISLGTLKSLGRIAAGQNAVFAHLLPTLGMVSANNAAHQMGVGPQPEGDLLSQLVNAEATNLQMISGMSLGHTLTGGRITALERGLDRSISFPSIFLSSKGLRDFFNGFFNAPHPAAADAGGKGSGSLGTLTDKGDSFAKGDLNNKRMGSNKEDVRVIVGTGDMEVFGSQEIQRTPEQGRFLTAALQMEIWLKDRDSDIRQTAIRVIGKIIPFLAEGDRAVLVTKLKDLANDPNADIRNETAKILEGLNSQEMRAMSRAPSTEESAITDTGGMVGGANIVISKQVRPLETQPLYYIFTLPLARTQVIGGRPLIPIEDSGIRGLALNLARLTQLRFEDKDFGKRAEELKSLVEIILHLEPTDRLPFLTFIGNQLEGEFWEEALKVFCDLIPHVEPSERLAILLKIEMLFDKSQIHDPDPYPPELPYDSYWNIREKAVEAAGKIIPHLDPFDRFPRVLELERKLMDSYGAVQDAAAKALDETLPHLTREQKLTLAETLEERLGQVDQGGGTQPIDQPLSKRYRGDWKICLLITIRGLLRTLRGH